MIELECDEVTVTWINNADREDETYRNVIGVQVQGGAVVILHRDDDGDLVNFDILSLANVLSVTGVKNPEIEE